MSKSQTSLIIDAGNTRIKIALFEAEEILDVWQIPTEDQASWKSKLQLLPPCPAIISSVLSKEATSELQQILPGSLLLQEAKIPIPNSYATPESLGADRLANAVAIAHLSKGKPALAIDLGTCIKCDFVDKNGQYQGGSISPGIRLRYQSLNQFTAALPLLNDRNPAKLIGTTTHESIHSGVMNGVEAELQGMIKSYEAAYQDLTIFVTGGDAAHFDFSAKKNIFANANLTLIGLYLILQANAH